MKRLKALTLAAALAVPATALAQAYPVYEPVQVERITIYDARYYDFYAREGRGLHSGGASAPDAALAHDVASAISADRRLADATVTVSAVDGRVSLSGLADPQQNDYAQQVARRVAGPGNVSGALSSDLG